ncbi:MAG: universal stress protein [Cyclobacteriaceae bacterium]
MNASNILVPIDFSTCSKNALKVAIGLAKRFGAKIHMVNAVHAHHPHPDFVGGTLIDSIMMDYENQVKESFKELESEIVELQDVPHEAERFLAYLTDAIYSVCKQKKIDLIVMGTRSDHSEIEHMIGTRTTDILEMSSVPVIVVPEAATSFDLKKIGFAFDLTEIKNTKKLKLINELAKSYGSEILIFSIVSNSESITALKQKQLKTIKEEFEGVEVSARTIEGNDVINGINEFAEAHELDMIVLVPRHRSFFGKLFKPSVTKNIAVDSKTPLLSFHE